MRHASQWLADVGLTHTQDQRLLDGARQDRCDYHGGGTAPSGSLQPGCRKIKGLPPLLRAMIIMPFLHSISSGAWAAPPSNPTPGVRTFVSGQGNDSNSCSVTQPCRTLQAAMALTLAGGEIYVLNSAGYGSVTINKSVTIVS